MHPLPSPISDVHGEDTRCGGDVCRGRAQVGARPALPLGGQMKLSLASAVREGTLEDGGGARPEIVITLELQGYGLQPVIIPPTVQTQVLRVGAELVHEQPDHLTTRLVLRLPRVFLTA
jgi:hypothetical protein